MAGLPEREKAYGPADDARQDAELAGLTRRVEELERRAGLRDAVLDAHSKRLREIDPLVGLVEFVESIKRFFANMRI